MSYRVGVLKVKARELSVLLTAALLVLGSSACSGGDGEDAAAPAEPAAASEEPSPSLDGTLIQPGEPGEPAVTGGTPTIPEAPEFNHSDVAFVQMMIPHHAQALEMAELARKYAVDRSVRALAARIRAAQAPEILTMSSWLEAQDVEVPEAGDDAEEYDHGEHGHDPMRGMLTDRQMRALAAARGADFDRLFLRGMIQHHRGAIAMADAVAVGGSDLLVSELAADVKATQAAEISRMQDLLRS
jgi:uncharacterized protein (DUF305 family)